MGGLTQYEIKILEMERHQAFNAKNKSIWKKAFQIYNDDHPQFYPIGMHCRSCYLKVYKYVTEKYAAVLNN